MSLCSKSFNFNPDLPEERRRLVLSMAPVDWAAEWLRPVTPNFKMVGPVLAGPGKALPAHIEVTLSLDILMHIKLHWSSHQQWHLSIGSRAAATYDAKFKDDWVCAGLTWQATSSTLRVIYQLWKGQA